MEDASKSSISMTWKIKFFKSNLGTRTTKVSSDKYPPFYSAQYVWLQKVEEIHCLYCLLLTPSLPKGFRRESASDPQEQRPQKDPWIKSRNSIESTSYKNRKNTDRWPRKIISLFLKLIVQKHGIPYLSPQNGSSFCGKQIEIKINIIFIREKNFY